MNKPVIICGEWQRTPWLHRFFFNRPVLRRRINICSEFGECGCRWQYAGEELPGVDHG